MTLSPELLAIIKDVKPASDEELTMLTEYAARCHTAYYAEIKVGEVLSLIARIVAAEAREYSMVRDYYDKAVAALSALEERGS
jgi:hypothetical protein